MSDTPVIISDEHSGQDLRAFLHHAMRLAELPVIRIKRRNENTLSVWATTGFEVLATRLIGGEVPSDDVITSAETLLAGLKNSAERYPLSLNPGLPMASSWPGALPLPTGFVHLDDLSARDLILLVREGISVARAESGPRGMPASLLSQEVIQVVSEAESVAIEMRVVFALTAMGFVRQPDGAPISETSPIEHIDANEKVRVRVSPAWLRLDARFGSVYLRRNRDLTLSVR